MLNQLLSEVKKIRLSCLDDYDYKSIEEADRAPVMTTPETVEKVCFAEKLFLTFCL
jgi:hypothetical protein